MNKPCPYPFCTLKEGSVEDMQQHIAREESMSLSAFLQWLDVSITKNFVESNKDLYVTIKRSEGPLEAGTSVIPPPAEALSDHCRTCGVRRLNHGSLPNFHEFVEP